MLCSFECLILLMGYNLVSLQPPVHLFFTPSWLHCYVQDLDMKLYLLLNSSILLSLGLGRLLLGRVMTRVAIGLAELAECAVVGLVLVLPERAAI